MRSKNLNIDQPDSLYRFIPLDYRGGEYAVIVVGRIDLLSLLLFSNHFILFSNHFILASSKKQADRWPTNTLQKNMTPRGAMGIGACVEGFSYICTLKRNHQVR